MSTYLKVVPLLAAIALSATMAAPALASKNDNRFQAKVALTNTGANICTDIYGALKTHEALADKHSGTPAAQKYSDAADKDWADGEAFGCSWAK